MSQSEVIAWLQAHPGWHETTEIADGLGKRHHQVYPVLRVLAEHGEVQRRNAKGRALEWSAAGVHMLVGLLAEPVDPNQTTVDVAEMYRKMVSVRLDQP